jgi:porin
VSKHYAKIVAHCLTSFKYLDGRVLSFILLCTAAPFANSAEQKQYYSGYKDLKDEAGPESVNRQLKEGDETRKSVFELGKFQRYFDWKTGLKKNYGLATGSNLLLLYQSASDSLPESDDTAAGYIYRWQGTWALIGSGTEHEGQIQWRLENRGNFKHYQAPGDLASSIGSASLVPGFGYSRAFDTDLSVFNWAQYFAGGKAAYAIGRLDFAAYIDPYVFQTFSKGFLNRSFIYNPSAPTTGIGALGLAVKGYLPINVTVGGGIYDSNAISGDFDLDTFKEHEYLTHLEFGWSPGFNRRKQDKIQFTWWRQDERVLAGVDEGSGWLMTASRQLGRFTGFVRYGNSDGGGGVAASEAFSLGFAWAREHKGTLYGGLGWAEPNQKKFARASGEKVIELGYQVQLTRHISILPNIQYLIDPANNPDEGRIAVISFRANVTL